MNIKIVTKNNHKIAIVDEKTRINNVDEALDLMANIQYQANSDRMVIFKES